MLVFDAVLMAGMTAVIIGFLTWAIYTQHRDAGCAHLRVPRLQVSVTLVKLDEPQTRPGSRVAL